MTYPETAQEAGIEGRVQVNFIINELGDVIFPKVKESIGGGCDEEAIRVVQLAKFEPGKQNEQPVKVRRTFTLQCADTNP
jgi:protein TonB